MSGLAAPQDTRAIDKNNLFARVWYTFFHDVSKRINNGSRIPTVSTPDATNLATAITLVNALKASHNDVTAALRGEDVT